MTETGLNTREFRLATLRSERTRILALSGVLAGILVLVLIRGSMSVAQGRRGEAWPFAVLLVAMMVYEGLWFRFISRATNSEAEVSDRTWIANILVESLLPTAALFLQIYTPSLGPARALTSPAVLAYFIFIILSALHLNPDLARLAGAFSAAGYTIVSVYILVAFPSVAEGQTLVAYGTLLSYTAFLLSAGFAAGAVTQQIRLHVLESIREIENRARLERDLGIARSIQQGLLPGTPPVIDGFDLAGWNKPADETGGDYFDWQALPGGDLAVTIADVTGHGIGSALCMAACRAYARAGFATESDLRQFTCRLNQLLYQDLPTGKFVTLAAGLLRPADSTLHLISAGHGPLLLYLAQEDRFHTYNAQGIPLGLLPSASYSGPHEIKFAPGDILVLVTDGFVEWANSRDEDFGEERLKKVIRSHRDKSSGTIISELYSAVVSFVGAVPQADDLTALVLKRV